MTAKFVQNHKDITGLDIEASSHILFVLPAKQTASVLDDVLEARLKRRKLKYAELAKTPLTADLPTGGMASWVVVDAEKSAFERHTALRKALQPLLEEAPASLTVVVVGDELQRQQAAEAALYVAWLNAAELPSRKKKQDKKPLKKIELYGCEQPDGFEKIRALAEANTLTRTLTMLPPNDLTPGLYRERIKTLAAEQGWAHEEYDLKKLRKLGAGAFVAVAQGSEEEDAAIVHLTYAPKGAQKSAALVGKGICFDTGGHNLKPARDAFKIPLAGNLHSS